MGGLEGPISKFATDPDEDLLGYIAIGAASDDGREAGNELYRRHSRPLFKILKRRWIGAVVDDEDIVDLVQDTFRQAVTSAANYKATGGDANRQRRACLNWLVGIANNLMKQALKRQLRVELVLEETPDPAAEVLVPEDVPTTGVVALVEKALETLEERERDILRVTMEFFRPGEQHQKLPSTAVATLAKQWGTTPDNLRTIRKRAMAKVKAFVELHLKKQESR